MSSTATCHPLHAAMALIHRFGERTTDAELLAAFAARRDETAFAEIVRRHGRLVHDTARRVLKDPIAADDIFQAAFFLLAKKAGSIRWGNTVGPWLYQAAYRLAVNARSRSIRRRDRAGIPTETPAPTFDPGAELARAEERDALDRGLARLPTSLRDPLVLCYLQGLTREEAASALECPPGVLKGRLERGRQRLREYLEGTGLSASTGLFGILPADPRWGEGAARSTARAAADYLATGAAPAAVTTLLRGATGVAVWKQAAGALAGLLVVCAVGAGQFFAPAPPRLAQRVSKAAPPKPAKAVVDALGDLLPPEALARMGSNRFHHGSNIQDVKGTADGKWIISHGGNIGYRIWEAATGKEHVPVGMPADARPDAFRRRERTQQWEVLIAPAGNTIVAVVPDRAEAITRIVDVFTGKEIAAVPVSMANMLTQHGFGRFGIPTLSPDGRWLVWKDYKEVKPSVFEWKLMAADLSDRKPKPVAWLDIGDRQEWSRGFSADSKSFLIHFLDAFEVWESGMAKRRLKVPKTKHPNRVGRAVISADGKTLALVQPGGKELILWDVVAGKKLPPLEESFDESIHFGPGAFSPDGRFLAAVVKEEVARVWDLTTRKKVRDLPSPSGRGWPVLFSPDGKRLVMNEMNDLCVLDVATGKPVPDLGRHPQMVLNAAFTKDGKRLLSAALDHGHVWEPRSGRKLRNLMDRPAYIRDVALSPDGRFIATGEDDGTVRLLDAKTFEEIRRVDAKREYGNTLVFTPDNSRLLVAGKKGIVRICEVKTGKVIEELRLGEPATRIALTPDGKHLLHHASDAKGITVRAFAGLEVERKIPTEKGMMNDFDVSPDGRWLATGSWDGLVRIYDLTTGREVRSHDTSMPNTQGHEKNVVYAVHFSPDGSLLAAGCTDGTVRVWEFATGGERFRFTGHTGPVLALTFSPDGTLLVSGSSDRSLVTWDITGASGVPKGKGAGRTASDAWEKLAEPDAKEGLRAIRFLVDHPAESIPLMAKELEPVPAVESATIRALIEQLDGDEFAKREEATKGLSAIRDAADSALREARLTSKSTEVRKRANSLLAGYDLFELTQERLRGRRAIEILERIRSREARKLLIALAAGAAGAQRTREAKAALARLGG